MKKFNWKYFVSTGLKASHYMNDKIHDFIHYNHVSGLISTSEYDWCDSVDFKPYMIDPKSLSDEELIYIFVGDCEGERERGYFIERDEDTIWLKFGSYSYCSIQNYMDLKTGMFKAAKIETFERMYKLHTLPEYMILLKVGEILDAGDVYET